MKLNVSKVFECSECSFVSGSERGLKSHKGRKHKAENSNFPRTCELCDFEFENIKEMRKHMLSHSYHRVEYKCEECDFYGTDDLAMEIHYRKTHSDQLECGLCDNAFSDLESLELHLFTCECYLCKKCDTNFKTLSNIKNHISEQHEGKSTRIFHIKQDRKNKEELSYVCHQSQDLFPEQK